MKRSDFISSSPLRRFTRSAVINGMRHSIITSPTINRKDRTDGRLYSLTDASNFLIIGIHSLLKKYGRRKAAVSLAQGKTPPSERLTAAKRAWAAFARFILIFPLFISHFTLLTQ